MWWRPVVLVYGLATAALVVAVKATIVKSGGISPLLTVYGLVVVCYLVSRAVMALRYRAVPPVEGDDVPSVVVVIPCFNEGSSVADTVIGVLALDYPGEQLRIVVVDDGSTDDSWEHIRRVAQDSRVHGIRFARNAGKRAAMAAGIRSAENADVVAFVDSDTILDRRALRAAVAPLVSKGSEDVAAVTGHAEVSNAAASWLARLQEVRYFASFRLIKAAESVRRRVVCASGCFSVYRRKQLLEVLPMWEGQTFLGQAANYGDDRALTTDILSHGYGVVYQRNAVAFTAVPTTWRAFWKQQLRWKKSWTRESLRLVPVALRWSPISSLPVLASICLQVFGPLVLVYSVVVRPLSSSNDPWLYLAGINAMAVMYGLMYGWAKRSAAWWPGAVYAIVYTCLMSFQVYWAWFRLRDTSWGTRGEGVNLSHPEVVEQVHGDVLASSLVPSFQATSETVTMPDPWSGRYVTGVAAMIVLALPLGVLLAAF